jgi:hypothetical protein
MVGFKTSKPPTYRYICIYIYIYIYIYMYLYIPNVANKIMRTIWKHPNNQVVLFSCWIVPQERVEFLSFSILFFSLLIDARCNQSNIVSTCLSLILSSNMVLFNITDSKTQANMCFCNISVTPQMRLSLSTNENCRNNLRSQTWGNECKMRDENWATIRMKERSKTSISTSTRKCCYI